MSLKRCDTAGECKVPIWASSIGPSSRHGFWPVASSDISIASCFDWLLAYWARRMTLTLTPDTDFMSAPAHAASGIAACPGLDEAQDGDARNDDPCSAIDSHNRPAVSRASGITASRGNMRLRLLMGALGAGPAACLRLATGLSSTRTTRTTLVRRTLPAVSLAADDQDAKEAFDALLKGAIEDLNAPVTEDTEIYLSIAEDLKNAPVTEKSVDTMTLGEDEFLNAISRLFLFEPLLGDGYKVHTMISRAD